MPRTPKLVIIALFLLFALSAYAWSFIGVYVTLAGSEERSIIAGSTIEYLKIFIWYLLGPQFPAVCAAFWFGTAAIIFLLGLT